MFVTETWLNSNVTSKEILPNGYNIYIYRSDLSLGRPGGGTLMLSNMVFSSAVVKLLPLLLWTWRHLLFNIPYIYPTTQNGFLCAVIDHLHDSYDMTDLRSFADNLFPSYDKIIIAGDFNLPNISWTDANYTLVDSLSQNFCDILDDYFMSQLCLTPTRE
jgi:hypothetical protein